MKHEKIYMDNYSFLVLCGVCHQYNKLHQYTLYIYEHIKSNIDRGR